MVIGDKSFQLVCYEQATQKQDVAVPITAKTSFSLLPGYFLRFKDENKENWAIRGARDQILKLCQHLAIVKSLAPGALKVAPTQDENSACLGSNCPRARTGGGPTLGSRGWGQSGYYCHEDQFGRARQARGSREIVAPQTC